MKSIEKRLGDLREAITSAETKAVWHNNLVRVIKENPERYPTSTTEGEEGFGIGISIQEAEGLLAEIQRAARILSGEES